MFLFPKNSKQTKLNQNLGSSVIYRDVNLGYAKKVILEGINIQINLSEKKFIGVVGQNGSGKSTFINSCLGILPPLSGEIQRPQGLFSYVPDSGFLWRDLRVDCCLSIFDENKEDSWLSLLNQHLDIVSLREMLIKDLSFGQNKRVQLFFALMNRPRLLLLDEPFVGLDKYQKEKILNLFKSLKEHLTILASFHEKLSKQDLVDDYFLLKNEKVTQITRPREDVFELI